MKTIAYISIIILTIALTNCNNPTEPPKPKIVKDPVDYSWTIDSIQFTSNDQTIMRSIWGDSPNDVYVVGHCSNPNGQMWHFDGDVWLPVSLPSMNRTLSFIYGIDSKNVWAVGSQGNMPNDSNFVVYYNGNSWKEKYVGSGHHMLCVWGDAPNNIWIGGINYLFNFNGIQWSKTIGYNNSSYDMQFISISGFSSNNVYFIKDDLSQYPVKENYYLYYYNGQSTNIVDSTNANSPHTFGGNLITIDKTLYSAGFGLFKRVNGIWQVILSDKKIARVNGTSSNHIFAAGDGQTIYFYNGIEWSNLTPIPNFNVPIYGIMVFNNEVFMVAHDGWTTYILHGK